MIRYSVILTSLLIAQAAHAGLQINTERAQFNYQLFCQGCHVGTGIGGKSVPNLKGFVGNFLLTQEGREYLVKVPGSAYSTMTDEQLAEVLNWILISFAEKSLSEDWKPFQATEVAVYRRKPLYEVVDYRAGLISRLPLNR